MQYDTIIRNATIVDGGGTKPFPGILAIEGERIALVGNENADVHGTRLIDATGCLLCPGFIDMHGHGDLHVLGKPGTDAKIAQGITTEVTGNCGMGVFPLPDDPKKRDVLPRMAADILGSYPKTWPWHDFDSYARYACAVGMYANIVGMQAHAPLRIASMEGTVNREATDRELSRMVELLQLSYAQGAAGFSSGLYYAPCMFSNRKELHALLTETARQDRLFAVHHRCEGNGVLDSLAEVLDLAKETGVRIQISHLKAIGRNNQPMVPRMLDLIDSYANWGVRVHFDQYPYLFGSTSLYSLLPPDFLRLDRDDLLAALEDARERQRMREQMLHPKGWDSIVELCGWEDVSVMHVEGRPELKGRSIASLARESGEDPFDVCFDLLKTGPSVAVMTDITQSESSLKAIMRHPSGCFGTDALYSGTCLHPRSTEATTHLLSRYWKQSEVLPIEQHVRRMTSFPARILGLDDRGMIAEGKVADLVLVDPDALAEGSGIAMVMVAGSVAWEVGRTPHGMRGRVLRFRNG